MPQEKMDKNLKKKPLIKQKQMEVVQNLENYLLDLKSLDEEDRRIINYDHEFLTEKDCNVGDYLLRFRNPDHESMDQKEITLKHAIEVMQ